MEHALHRKSLCFGRCAGSGRQRVRRGERRPGKQCTTRGKEEHGREPHREGHREIAGQLNARADAEEGPAKQVASAKPAASKKNRDRSVLFNFRGLRAYKEKFNPVWEPHSLVYPGALKLPGIVADVSALVAGDTAGSFTSNFATPRNHAGLVGLHYLRRERKARRAVVRPHR